MENAEMMNRKLEKAGWGLLAILWGATILFDFVPFGAGLIGTGLILLGINLFQSINHLPIENDNTVIAILLLAWGGLELARRWLHQWFPSADLDWVIFAILLVGLGVLLLTRALLLSGSKPFRVFPGAHEE